MKNIILKAFKVWILIFVCFALGKSIEAKDLTQEQENALKGAIEELTNPTKRLETLKKDPKAAESDKILKEVGGEFSEEIYQLAGKVLETIAVQAQGDPQKMEEILQRAKKDPAGFAKTFTPEEQKMLKGLGQKVEKSKKKTLP